MKVLVAGSEGSLMQRVIPLLLEAGHEVLGCDNMLRYGKIHRQRSYDFRQCDLCSEAEAAEVTAGVDVVLQAAAQVYGTRGFHMRGADILSGDVRLHANLLQESVRQGVQRFVYISSSVVYEKAGTFPLAEGDTEGMMPPSTDYGLSKLVGERLCAAYERDYGLPYTIWRPFNIITPQEEADAVQGMSHVFADFIALLLLRQQNPMDIIGTGYQTRCFTWIDDVAAPIAQRLVSEETRNEVFNLGNMEPVTMRGLAERIYAKGVERGVIKPGGALAFNCLPAYPADVQRREPDSRKAMKLLGWQPTVGLDEALDRCIEYALGNP